MSCLISVIIPTYNRAEQLILTLTAFDLQTCSKDIFEVIVIDDGSTDHTKQVVESFNASFSLTYVTIDHNKGRSSARNYGLSKSTGKYIIFCDADFLVIPEFVQIIYDYHKRYPKSVISGVPNSLQRAYVHYYPNFYDWQKQDIYDVLQPHGLWKEEYWESEKRIISFLTEDALREDFNNLKPYILPRDLSDELKDQFQSTDVAPWFLFITRCVSVEKELLDRVGWFDEEFIGWGAEDWDLGYRLHRHGIPYQSCSEILGYHQEHPREESEKENNIKNSRRLFEKYGFSDPELNILVACKPWSISKIKNKLRTLKTYEQIGEQRKSNRMKNSWKQKAMRFALQNN